MDPILVRRVSKNRSDAVTPLFLGALTGFIPCGMTQAMMAATLVLLTVILMSGRSRNR